MITKLALTVAIVVFCIASPAFAQSFDPEAGSGNIAAGNQTAPQTAQTVVHRSGLNSYAMVPRQAAPVNAADPALNGGGSSGYNETIRKY
jgi:hypothetical protein